MVIRKDMPANEDERLIEHPVDPVTAARDVIYGEIDAERARQDQQWGGPEHDDGNMRRDWLVKIVVCLGKAVGGVGPSYLSAEARERREAYHYRTCLVETAATAIAAIEAHDRKAAGRPAAAEPTPPPAEPLADGTNLHVVEPEP